MKIPVFLPVTRELGFRDEFAQDCLLQRGVHREPDFLVFVSMTVSARSIIKGCRAADGDVVAYRWNREYPTSPAVGSGFQVRLPDTATLSLAHSPKCLVLGFVQVLPDEGLHIGGRSTLARPSSKTTLATRAQAAAKSLKSLSDRLPWG
jgi:hypothetical protein